RARRSGCIAQPVRRRRVRLIGVRGGAGAGVRASGHGSRARPLAHGRAATALVWRPAAPRSFGLRAPVPALATGTADARDRAAWRRPPEAGRAAQPRQLWGVRLRDRSGGGVSVVAEEQR